MLFNLECDERNKVLGYVVPDAFSAVPVLRIMDGDRLLLIMEANEIREALIGAGRHETGRCGFRLDESLLPGLSDIVNLQIFEHENGVLVYRRRHPHMIAQKILRLETHMFPLWRLDNFFQSMFQYYSKGLEAFGRETVSQLFLLNHIDSTYLSGRILYKNYAYYIESGFKVVVILQDPYAEIAERLLVASKLRKVGTQHLGLRDSMTFDALMNFAETLSFEDDKSLKRALRDMPHDVAISLANPVVRQLTAATPDEMPAGGAVAAALDLMASFALVGLREKPEIFIGGLGELLKVDSRTLPTTPQFPTVAPLAARLREFGAVEHLIEKDLELYHTLVQVMKNVSAVFAPTHGQLEAPPNV